MFFDLLYRVFIFFYALFSIPCVLYASICHKKRRRGWGQKLFGTVPTLPPPGEGKKRIWFHGVSVGEVNLVKPLVKELEATRPDWEFVVSSTSETGFELAKKLFADKAPVFYCPFDLKSAVCRAFKRIKPDLLVLVELELWPVLIKTAHDLGVRVAIVNGRVSDRSFKGYRLIKPALAPTFRRIDLIAAQDELAAGYFRELSPCPERVSVTGSVKFDGIMTDRGAAEIEKLGALVGVEEDDVVFLAGSTQDPEEAGALETYRRLYREFPRLKLILTPRHRERFEDVARLLNASEFAWTRRSELAPGTTPPVPLDPSPEKDPRRVVLIDTLGELGAWWGLASIAFVGGSWGNRGGQNMLEPAGFGAAVSFGPNTRNFRKIVEALLKADGAVVVADVDEMEQFVRRCLVDPCYRNALGTSARDLALKNAGAARRSLDALVKLIDN